VGKYEFKDKNKPSKLKTKIARERWAWKGTYTFVTELNN
jgi:hypothetical protein